MRICSASIIALFLATTAGTAEITLGNFSSGLLVGWQEEIFRNKIRTSYHLVNDAGKTVLMARSKGAASGMLKKVDIDAKKSPLLRWSWKIMHTIKKEDAARKSGDDFAARIYVVFPGTFFWQTKAINYVWSARMPKGTAVKSAYTGNAFIVAVETGEDKRMTWVQEERNIYQDYLSLFGEDPPRLGAVAVMTDTDDTGDEATAWYGDISINQPVSPASPAVFPTEPAHLR
jgi:hypothetical protein